MIITLRQLQLILPKAGAAAVPFLDPINQEIKTSAINTPTRLAAFISQVGHETQSLTKLKENLNYNVEGLLATFSRARISEANARKYGRIDGKQAANKDMIANLVYGGDWGKKNLGNGATTDGSRYIGRGGIHLTGLWNYAAAGKRLGMDLVEHPEQLEQPGPAIRVAGDFWTVNRLNEYADKGDIANISSIVNTGKPGRIAKGAEERKDIYTRALKILSAG